MKVLTRVCPGCNTVHDLPLCPSRSEENSVHVQEWNALAAEQERLAAAGLVLPTIAASRAELYRRTARSIELETETGRAHCACCLKPMGAGIRL